MIGDEPCVTISFLGIAPTATQARVPHRPCRVDFWVTSDSEVAIDHLVSAIDHLVSTLGQHASVCAWPRRLRGDP